MLRDVIARCAAQGNFRLASVVAGQLLNLLMAGGRLTEALTVADEMAGYTRQAKLGPWSQLLAECQRLQVLNAMGRYDEVLAAVEKLRPQLDSLPEKSEADETANPWNVREGLLDTGREAAMRSERWEAALELNAQIVRAQQSRGADALELARTRFNDYGPLLRLRRYDAARQLLVGCRAVFEAEHAIPELGKVYSALADLEDKTGGRAEAVRFEQIALGYMYQAGQPEDCAISHNNLANYLERQAADPATVLAHRLAAGAIRVQIQFRSACDRACTTSPTPTSLPRRRLLRRWWRGSRRLEGVRFAALFEHLPRTAPDGDAALAAVWQLVAEERSRKDAKTQRNEAVRSAVTSLLAARTAGRVRVGRRVEVAAALAQLSPEQQQALMEQMQSAMQQARLIGVPEPSGPDMNQVLQNFAPLLEAIAAVARGDDGPREQIEAMLPQLEQNGWQLTDAVHRLWAGERDPEALTAGIDPNSAHLIRHLLALANA